MYYMKLLVTRYLYILHYFDQINPATSDILSNYSVKYNTMLYKYYE